MGTINKVFLHNGVPMNGAIAQLWKITAFAAYADSGEDVLDNPLEAWMVECLTTGGGTFAVGDVIKMVDECCLIWKISGNTIYIIRGWHGTTPAQHPVNTDINDETITPPVVDDAVPGAGQQGGNITTGVAYGGDGAYRFDDVPEMEYYASVTYDAHITYVHCFVERNDITPEQIMTVQGDMLYRDANTVTRKPIGAAGHIPLSDGVDWAWTASGGYIATREFFVPVTYGTQVGAWKLDATGDFPSVPTANAGDVAHVAFKVPHDFTAITNAEFIVIPLATQLTANWDIESDYGAIGQAYNVHSETDNATTYNVTNNELFAVDLDDAGTGILDNLAADDYVGIKIHLGDNAHDFAALGVRFKYT